MSKNKNMYDMRFVKAKLKTSNNRLCSPIFERINAIMLLYTYTLSHGCLLFYRFQILFFSSFLGFLIVNLIHFDYLNTRFQQLFCLRGYRTLSLNI